MKHLRAFCLAVTLSSFQIAVVPSLVYAESSDNGRLEYGDLRTLVDRTQADLRASADLGHGNKQRDRYHKAQDHLSKLDRSLSHGKYNKGALNNSIDGLKSLLDHNTLQASARDALMRDLTDLKIARDRH